MVSRDSSVSIKRRGGARQGAGRRRVRQKTTDLPSVRIDELRRAGLTPNTTAVTVVHGSTTLRVRIEHTPCGFGGTRPWLSCPRCGHRVCALYIKETELACRHCFKLQYASQAEGPVARSYRRTRKIRTKLLGSSFPDKPKWMRWPTFQRRCEVLKQERDFRTEILALAVCGQSQSAAALTVQVALAVRDVSCLSDKELGRAISRLGKLRTWRSGTRVISRR